MIRESTYGEFSSGIQGRLGSGRAPMSATIEITRRCPLKCSHCYNNLPMGDATARNAELSGEEIKNLLDEMAEAGVFWLLFSGGEIFARRDFLDLYLYARSKGFLITLFTNATMIDEKIADLLSEYPPFVVEVTVYGKTKKTYEELTQIPGSYEKCLRGIELLRERRVPLKLKTVAVTINRHEVRDMQRWSEEELGVDFKFDGLINPRVDCSQAPLAVRLAPEELVSLDLEDPERVESFRELADRYEDLALTPQERLYSCGGGVRTFAVDPYGGMSICVLSEAEKFDLRKGPLDEGWSGFLKEVRSRKVTRPTKCNQCSIKSFCGMCPANGELENEDPEAPVEYLCEVAHLRAAAFDINVRPHGDCAYCNEGADAQRVSDRATILKETVGQVPVPGSSSDKPVGSQRTACPTGGCDSCGSLT